MDIQFKAAPIEQADSENPLLAFVHVPKTGGTSLQGVFQANDPPMYNIRHPEQAEAFLAMSLRDQQKYFGVFGHMPFGIHRYTQRPVSYITFLRHPVERVLSAYAHNLRHPEEPGADIVAKMGLAWTARPANFICRYLADYDFLQPPNRYGGFWLDHSPPDVVPREYLEQSKANLDRCAFIGVQEFYEEDVRALGRLQTHPIHIPQTVPKVKTGYNRLQQSDLTAEQLNAIRAANQLDMELYAYALELRRQWGGPLRPLMEQEPKGGVLTGSKLIVSVKASLGRAKI